MVREFLLDEDGQGLAEYAVIVGVVAIGAIGFLKLFGTGLQGIFTGLIQRLQAGLAS